MFYNYMPSRPSFVQKQIKQTKPFSSLEAEAGVGLVIVADILRRGCAAVVEQGGVTAQQYNVLRILRGAGEEGLPTREVAARLIEKSPGITRFIDQLEARGLLERRRSTRDRRQVFCTITQAGLELLRKLDKPIEEWERQSLSMFHRRELKQLLQFLERIHSFQAQRKEKRHGRNESD